VNIEVDLKAKKSRSHFAATFKKRAQWAFVLAA